MKQLNQVDKKKMATDWEEWYDEHGSELMWVLVTLGIVACFITLLTVMSMIGFMRETNVIKSTQPFKLLFIFALIIGTSSSWCFFVSVDLSITDFGSILEEDLRAIGILGYGINCSIVLIIFGLRIIKAFKNTSHEMSKLFHGWLFLIIFLIVIGFITVIIILFVNKNNTSLQASASAIPIMFATINGIILLFIFIKKLNQIITHFLIEFGTISGDTMIELNMQLSAGLQHDLDPEKEEKRNTVDANANVKTHTGYRLDKNMILLNKIISDMIKYTILIIFAMISTTIVGITIPIIVSNGNIPTVYVRLIATIDMFINEICLLLQFKISRKYYKLLCKICINKCQQRLTKQINNNVKNFQKVSSVELKVLPSGGIGVSSVDMAMEPEAEKNGSKNVDNFNIHNQTQKTIDGDDNNKQPAVTTMQSVEMQLN